MSTEPEQTDSPSAVGPLRIGRRGWLLAGAAVLLSPAAVAQQLPNNAAGAASGAAQPDIDHWQLLAQANDDLYIPPTIDRPLGVDAGPRMRVLRQDPRDHRDALGEEDVRDAMRRDRDDARVREDHLLQASRGRVVGVRRLDVRVETTAEIRQPSPSTPFALPPSKASTYSSSIPPAACIRRRTS